MVLFLIVLVAKSEAVREIQLYRAKGDKKIVDNIIDTQRYDVTNILDKNDASDPFYCFVSKQGKNGIASIHFAWAKVTHVKLLNVDDASGPY